MSEPIDPRIPIGEHLYPLLEALGLHEPKLVGELIVRPRFVTATVWLLNENGDKYVDPETHEGAREILTFEVST